MKRFITFILMITMALTTTFAKGRDRAIVHSSDGTVSVYERVPGTRYGKLKAPKAEKNPELEQDFNKFKTLEKNFYKLHGKWSRTIFSTRDDKPVLEAFEAYARAWLELEKNYELTDSMKEYINRSMSVSLEWNKDFLRRSEIANAKEKIWRKLVNEYSN